MKIIHISPRYYPYAGGVEVVVKNIAEQMEKMGHVVKVYATDPLIVTPKKKMINNVEVNLFPSFAPKEAYYLPSFKMLTELSREKADIFHCHSIHSLTALTCFTAYRLNAGTKLIISPYFHGRGHTKLAEVFHIPYKPLITYVLKNVDGIITNSKTQKQLIQERFPYASKKMFIAYDGVNLEGIQSQLPLKVNEDHKILLYVGRLEKYKNIQVAIESLINLPINYHLYIIGSGPYRDNLIRMVQSSSLSERVHFLGYLPDSEVYQWLKTANVFVHLSSLESFGMTCIESLVAGTPVIANDDGIGLTETINLYPNSIFKFKVGKQSTKILAKLILDACKSRCANEDLRQFSWASISDKIIKTYEEVKK